MLLTIALSHQPDLTFVYAPIRILLNPKHSFAPKEEMPLFVGRKSDFEDSNIIMRKQYSPLA